MTRYTNMGYPKFCNPTKFSGTPLLPKKSELNQNTNKDTIYSIPSAQTQNENAVPNKKRKKKGIRKKGLDSGTQITSMVDGNARCGKKVKKEGSLETRSIALKSVNPSISLPTHPICQYCGSQLHPTKKCKPHLDQELLTSAGIVLPEASADDDGMHFVLKKIEENRMRKRQENSSSLKKSTASKKVVFF
ncbi:hypothetical protein HMI54_003211 [Coelomomyces lativittatus]|nr:hypothetical protein HMI55_000786 [Coelomomyces lativittatus]KAJ1508479.1 hypothetical protein HMI54_003211 [Coelomomyces lativittatus]KAJ1513156.1 hypothetical protein HMI56_002942 [Coelomomyces lativittatus]